MRRPKNKSSLAEPLRKENKRQLQEDRLLGRSVEKRSSAYGSRLGGAKGTSQEDGSIVASF